MQSGEYIFVQENWYKLHNSGLTNLLSKIFAVVVLCSVYEMIHKNFESDVNVKSLYSYMTRIEHV